MTGKMLIIVIATTVTACGPFEKYWTHEDYTAKVLAPRDKSTSGWDTWECIVPIELPTGERRGVQEPFELCMAQVEAGRMVKIRRSRHVSNGQERWEILP